MGAEDARAVLKLITFGASSINFEEQSHKIKVFQVLTEKVACDNSVEV